MNYECEICKNASVTGKWPRRFKWKTQKGIDGHFCYKTELLHRQQREQAQAAQREVDDARLAERVKSLGHMIGASVWCVLRIVTKPERDSRGVRVRYEEECTFRAAQTVIKSISLHGFVTDFGTQLLQQDIFPDQQSAEAEAARRLAGHREFLDMSARMR